MNRTFRRLRAAVAAAVFALAAGCASSSSGPPSSFSPGEDCEFEGVRYKLMQVDQDYVVMRHREPDGEAGAISGFVDEVFRVPRYRLGEGMWTSPDLAPGVCLRWLGLDSFALEGAPEPAEPEQDAPEVVQAEPAGEPR